MKSPWRDIADAPKDGTKVDVWVEEIGERYPDAYFCADSGFWVWDIEVTSQRLVFSATPPTHYMPLDLPEKQHAALQIAVEALEEISVLFNLSEYAQYRCKTALTQIEEALI